MEAAIEFLAKKVYDRENGYDIVARRLGSKFYIPLEQDAIFKVQSFYPSFSDALLLQSIYVYIRIALGRVRVSVKPLKYIAFHRFPSLSFLRIDQSWDPTYTFVCVC